MRHTKNTTSLINQTILELHGRQLGVPVRETYPGIVPSGNKWYLFPFVPTENKKVGTNGATPKVGLFTFVRTFLLPVGTHWKKSYLFLPGTNGYDFFLLVPSGTLQMGKKHHLSIGYLLKVNKVFQKQIIRGNHSTNKLFRIYNHPRINHPRIKIARIILYSNNYLHKKLFE